MFAIQELDWLLDNFNDPIRFAGKCSSSRRQTGLGAPQIGSYDRDAGPWIAATSLLTPKVGSATHSYAGHWPYSPFRFQARDAGGRGIR